MSEINNTKKRIAFYIGGLCKGGAERVICNLAEYFYSIGYEVFMVTKLRDDEEYELSDGIRRIIADITPEEETGRRLGNLKARIDKLRKIWIDIQPDIIVSFIKKNNLMALASARPLKIPVIVSVRSAPARELSGRGVKATSFLLFRGAAGIVLQTNEAKEYFPKYLQKKAVVLPNSINPSFLKSGMTTEEENIEKRKQIITVGRIDDNKNQKMLVEAFSDIASLYPDWTLELYGDGRGGNALREYVKSINLSDRIHFHGVVNDVPNRMKTASIFVLPSKIEGMPNALIEAMVMGLACISTNCPCGGPRDLIDGNNGILIPVDDREALANSLRKLIDDEELRNQMGKEASKIIHKLHPDVVNRVWQEYIESKI